jgi:hypothetical protein
VRRGTRKNNIFFNLEIVVVLDAEGGGLHVTSFEASLVPAFTLVAGAVGE